MTILLYDLVGRDPQRPFSPHCWKTTMSLAHKGLDFRSVPTPFTSVAAAENGASRTVPLIRDGDAIVSDSFDIALYLEKAYPERPSLFGGQGGEASARFIERWSQMTIHPYLGASVLVDIHSSLDPEDQAFFRQSRESRFGRPLEDIPARRDDGLAAFRASLEPLRSTLSYQPWIGGKSPLFADYIVFGAFQWARVISPYQFLAEGDPVLEWFDRCLELHDGLGRKVPSAA